MPFDPLNMWRPKVTNESNKTLADLLENYSQDMILSNHHMTKSLYKAATALRQQEKDITDLVDGCRDAVLQLEYLDEKFDPTGTTGATISQLEGLIARHSNTQKSEVE